MTLIEQIKADREAGTPGPWHKVGASVQKSPNESAIAVCVSAGDRDRIEASENARRIARVPDLEAALLAAEELAGAALSQWEVGTASTELHFALLAYRKATEAVQ